MIYMRDDLDSSKSSRNLIIFHRYYSTIIFFINYNIQPWPRCTTKTAVFQAYNLTRIKKKTKNQTKKWKKCFTFDVIKYYLQTNYNLIAFVEPYDYKCFFFSPARTKSVDIIHVYFFFFIKCDTGTAAAIINALKNIYIKKKEKRNEKIMHGVGFDLTLVCAECGQVWSNRPPRTYHFYFDTFLLRWVNKSHARRGTLCRCNRVRDDVFSCAYIFIFFLHGFHIKIINAHRIGLYPLRSLTPVTGKHIFVTHFCVLRHIMSILDFGFESITVQLLSLVLFMRWHFERTFRAVCPTLRRAILWKFRFEVPSELGFFFT